jgi:hypothetical protein
MRQELYWRRCETIGSRLFWQVDRLLIRTIWRGEWGGNGECRKISLLLLWPGFVRSGASHSFWSQVRG